jgi:ABC-2 type transport system ATP-binding protein
MGDAPIRAEGLTKYYGEVRGIEGVDLEVEEGEVFGFIGPNGAGKTTTIRCLLDLIFPTAGTARVFGLDSHTHSKEIKRSVGYLPSEDYYYKGMTAQELLRYSSRFHGIDARVAAERMTELAGVLDLDLGRKIKELSRGNRRKVSIIKSLIPSPRLLILDEPTSGLDPVMQVRFFELLEAERERGTTVFFSSHILSEVQRVCDRVAIVKGGRIVRTADIAGLQRERLKKVILELTEDADVGDLALPGVSEVERRGDTVQFLYSGAMESLLGYLVDKGIHRKTLDIVIERASLEEIFIDYYETPEEGTQ